MRKVFGCVLILAALWALKDGYNYWRSFKTSDPDSSQSQRGGGPHESGDGLPGLPADLEPYLKEAQKEGVSTFKKWLNYYGPRIQDPRLAWIQLDYVLMVSDQDMSEARRVFAEVKARTPKSSPVYPRIQRLAKAYE